jgi:alpha-beta hydrolase superfamily lysophospholipase
VVELGAVAAAMLRRLDLNAERPDTACRTSLRRNLAAPGRWSMDERVWTDVHGVEVFGRWWPVDEPTGMVLIAHGASEHSGRYDRFARALNAAGYSAVAIDHRGHGRTGAVTGPGLMGAGGGHAVIDDLEELRGAIGGAAPLFFFGHSMGSMIGLAYLTEHSPGLAGGVLCGFAADISDVAALVPALQEVADAGRRDEPAVGLLAAYNAPFEPARTPYDWLSRDPAEVDLYVADPLSGDDNPLTYGYVLDLFAVLGPATTRLDAITCPVLVIAGDQDSAAAMGANPRGLADGLRAAGVPVDLTLYPGARHELLNETNRDQVTADIVAWLDAHR